MDIAITKTGRCAQTSRWLLSVHRRNQRCLTRWALVACYFAATTVSFAQTPVTQQPRTLKLSWRAPLGCPSQSSVERAVAELVRLEPISPLEATVHIEQSGNRWVASLNVQNGERTLEGNSCDEITETVALVLALALDPTASNRAATNTNAETAPTSSPESSAASATDGNDDRGSQPVVIAPIGTPARRRDRDANTVIRLPLPEASKGSPRRFTLGGGVSVVGEVGSLPKPSYAGTGRVRVAHNDWAVSAGYSLSRAQNTRVTTLGVGAHFALEYFFVEPCLATLVVGYRTEFCANFEWGKMEGTGIGLKQAYSGATDWLALGGASGVFFKVIEPLFIVPRFGLTFPLYRPAFEIDGLTQPVHRPGWASGRAELLFLAAF